MIFDGGLFFLMLGLGILFLISSFKFGPIFQLVAGIIFMSLSIVMFAGYDVAFETTVTDGSNQINQTNYVIGNGETTNENNNWLAWIFVIIAIMSFLLFFFGLMSSGGA